MKTLVNWICEVERVFFKKEKYQRYTDELKRLKNKLENENRQPTFEERQRAEYLLNILDSIDDACELLGSGMDKRLLPGGGGREQYNGIRIFKSLGEQLQAVARSFSPGGETDPRLHEVRAATGLSEGIGSDGGFLLQPTFTNDIYQVAWDEGMLSKLCRKVTIGSNSNSMKIPGIDETSRADGSRQGGVRSYYVAEAAEKTASQPKFRQIELNTSKLVVLVYCTDELLDDAQALGQYVESAAGREIAFCMDRDIITGSGGGQPLGIKNSGCIVTQAAETGQAADTIEYMNVLNMWSRLFPSSQKSAIWMINQTCIPQLYSMSLAIGTGGAPVFVPSQVASEGPAGYLFGRPVYTMEQCEVLGDTGDIYLCDFKNGYILADKGSAQPAWSVHVRFIHDESIFRLVYRWDGQPYLGSAVTPYNGTDKLSHFVKLAAR